MKCSGDVGAQGSPVAKNAPPGHRRRAAEGSCHPRAERSRVLEMKILTILWWFNGEFNENLLGFNWIEWDFTRISWEFHGNILMEISQLF